MYSPSIATTARLIQTNSTDIRQLSASVGRNGRKEASGGLAGQAGDQSYDQAFSAIAADRDVRNADVPAVRARLAAFRRGDVAACRGAASISWPASTRAVVEATNNERSFAPDGSVRALTSTPAFQRTSGIYVQATGRPASRVTVIAGARGDVRQRTRDEGWLDGDSAFSPRISAAWSSDLARDRSRQPRLVVSRSDAERAVSRLPRRQRR